MLLGAKLTQLATHWNTLARDARWAVLSAADRKGNRWDDAAFWATGIHDVAGVLAACGGSGLRPGRATLAVNRVEFQLAAFAPLPSTQLQFLGG